MGSTDGREVELKLEVRPQDVARISALRSLPDARVSAPRATQIYSVYFDTANHELRRTGYSLRVRHAGAKRLQTVKMASAGANAALDRREDEVTLQGPGPDIAQISDDKLRAQIGAALAQDTLEPVFETTVLRTTRTIRTSDGGEIELAIDTGDVRANGHARTICEVELELKLGAPAALYAVARALSAKAPMRLTRLTKSDRGYALCGEAVAPPQKAKAPDLPRHASVEDAFRATLRACLAQLLANEPAVVERRDVEGLHQMRVALRRLRAALKIFSDLGGNDGWSGLEDEVKALAQLCGEARDLDVFETELLPAGIAELKARGPALTSLRASAAAAREVAWQTVTARLAEPGFTALVLDLATLCEGGPDALGAQIKDKALKAPARNFAAGALDKAYRKCAKLGRKLEGLGDEDRHTLRKRLKELRYSGEFFSGLFAAKAARVYSKRLNALQDTFGALNDLATAQRLIVHLLADSPQGSPLAQAGEDLVALYARSAHDARGQAIAAWTKFVKHKPFWHEA